MGPHKDKRSYSSDSEVAKTNCRLERMRSMLKSVAVIARTSRKNKASSCPQSRQPPECWTWFDSWQYRPNVQRTDDSLHLCKSRITSTFVRSLQSRQLLLEAYQVGRDTLQSVEIADRPAVAKMFGLDPVVVNRYPDQASTNLPGKIIQEMNFKEIHDVDRFTLLRLMKEDQQEVEKEREWREASEGLAKDGKLCQCCGLYPLDEMCPEMEQTCSRCKRAQMYLLSNFNDGESCATPLFDNAACDEKDDTGAESIHQSLNPEISGSPLPPMSITSQNTLEKENGAKIGINSTPYLSQTAVNSEHATSTECKRKAPWEACLNPPCWKKEKKMVSSSTDGELHRPGSSTGRSDSSPRKTVSLRGYSSDVGEHSRHSSSVTVIKTEHISTRRPMSPSGESSASSVLAFPNDAAKQTTSRKCKTRPSKLISRYNRRKSRSTIHGLHPSRRFAKSLEDAENYGLDDYRYPSRSYFDRFRALGVIRVFRRQRNTTDTSGRGARSNQSAGPSKTPSLTNTSPQARPAHSLAETQTDDTPAETTKTKRPTSAVSSTPPNDTTESGKQSKERPKPCVATPHMPQCCPQSMSRNPKRQWPCGGRYAGATAKDPCGCGQYNQKKGQDKSPWLPSNKGGAPLVLPPCSAVIKELQKSGQLRDSSKSGASKKEKKSKSAKRQAEKAPPDSSSRDSANQGKKPKDSGAEEGSRSPNRSNSSRRVLTRSPSSPGVARKYSSRTLNRSRSASPARSPHSSSYENSFQHRYRRSSTPLHSATDSPWKRYKACSIETLSAVVSCLTASNSTIPVSSQHDKMVATTYWDRSQFTQYPSNGTSQAESCAKGHAKRMTTMDTGRGTGVNRLQRQGTDAICPGVEAFSSVRGQPKVIGSLQGVERSGRRSDATVRAQHTKHSLHTTSIAKPTHASVESVRVASSNFTSLFQNTKPQRKPLTISRPILSFDRKKLASSQISCDHSPEKNLNSCGRDDIRRQIKTPNASEMSLSREISGTLPRQLLKSGGIPLVGSAVVALLVALPNGSYKTVRVSGGEVFIDPHPASPESSERTENKCCFGVANEIVSTEPVKLVDEGSTLKATIPTAGFFSGSIPLGIIPVNEVQNKQDNMDFEPAFTGKEINSDTPPPRADESPSGGFPSFDADRKTETTLQKTTNYTRFHENQNISMLHSSEREQKQGNNHRLHNVESDLLFDVRQSTSSNVFADDKELSKFSFLAVKQNLAVPEISSPSMFTGNTFLSRITSTKDSDPQASACTLKSRQQTYQVPVASRATSPSSCFFDQRRPLSVDSRDKQTQVVDQTRHPAQHLPLTSDDRPPMPPNKLVTSQDISSMASPVALKQPVDVDPQGSKSSPYVLTQDFLKLPSLDCSEARAGASTPNADIQETPPDTFVSIQDVMSSSILADGKKQPIKSSLRATASNITSSTSRIRTVESKGTVGSDVLNKTVSIAPSPTGQLRNQQSITSEENFRQRSSDTTRKVILQTVRSSRSERFESGLDRFSSPNQCCTSNSESGTVLASEQNLVFKLRANDVKALHFHSRRDSESSLEKSDIASLRAETAKSWTTSLTQDFAANEITNATLSDTNISSAEEDVPKPSDEDVHMTQIRVDEHTDEAKGTFTSIQELDFEPKTKGKTEVRPQDRQDKTPSTISNFSRKSSVKSMDLERPYSRSKSASLTKIISQSSTDLRRKITSEVSSRNRSINSSQAGIDSIHFMGVKRKTSASPTSIKKSTEKGTMECEKSSMEKCITHASNNSLKYSKSLGRISFDGEVPEVKRPKTHFYIPELPTKEVQPKSAKSSDKNMSEPKISDNSLKSESRASNVLETTTILKSSSVNTCESQEGYTNATFVEPRSVAAELSYPDNCRAAPFSAEKRNEMYNADVKSLSNGTPSTMSSQSADGIGHEISTVTEEAVAEERGDTDGVVSAASLTPIQKFPSDVTLRFHIEYLPRDTTHTDIESVESTESERRYATSETPSKASRESCLSSVSNRSFASKRICSSAKIESSNVGGTVEEVLENDAGTLPKCVLSDERSALEEAKKADVHSISEQFVAADCPSGSPVIRSKRLAGETSSSERVQDNTSQYPSFISVRSLKTCDSPSSGGRSEVALFHKRSENSYYVTNVNIKCKTSYVYVDRDPEEMSVGATVAVSKEKLFHGKIRSGELRVLGTDVSRRDVIHHSKENASVGTENTEEADPGEKRRKTKNGGPTKSPQTILVKQASSRSVGSRDDLGSECRRMSSFLDKTVDNNLDGDNNNSCAKESKITMRSLEPSQEDSHFSCALATAERDSSYSAESFKGKEQGSLSNIHDLDDSYGAIEQYKRGNKSLLVQSSHKVLREKKQCNKDGGSARNSHLTSHRGHGVDYSGFREIYTNYSHIGSDSFAEEHDGTEELVHNGVLKARPSREIHSTRQEGERWKTDDGGSKRVHRVRIESCPLSYNESLSEMTPMSGRREDQERRSKEDFDSEESVERKDSTSQEDMACELTIDREVKKCASRVCLEKPCVTFKTPEQEDGDEVEEFEASFDTPVTERTYISRTLNSGRESLAFAERRDVKHCVSVDADSHTIPRISSMISEEEDTDSAKSVCHSSWHYDSRYSGDIEPTTPACSEESIVVPEGSTYKHADLISEKSFKSLSGECLYTPEQRTILEQEESVRRDDVTYSNMTSYGMETNDLSRETCLHPIKELPEGEHMESLTKSNTGSSSSEEYIMDLSKAGRFIAEDSDTPPQTTMSVDQISEDTLLAEGEDHYAPHRKLFGHVRECDTQPAISGTHRISLKSEFFGNLKQEEDECIPLDKVVKDPRAPYRAYFGVANDFVNKTRNTRKDVRKIAELFARTKPIRRTPTGDRITSSSNIKENPMSEAAAFGCAPSETSLTENGVFTIVEEDETVKSSAGTTHRASDARSMAEQSVYDLSARTSLEIDRDVAGSDRSITNVYRKSDQYPYIANLSKSLHGSSQRNVSKCAETLSAVISDQGMTLVDDHKSVSAGSLKPTSTDTTVTDKVTISSTNYPCGSLVKTNLAQLVQTRFNANGVLGTQPQKQNYDKFSRELVSLHEIESEMITGVAQSDVVLPDYLSDKISLKTSESADKLESTDFISSVMDKSNELTPLAAKNKRAFGRPHSSRRSRGHAFIGNVSGGYRPKKNKEPVALSERSSSQSLSNYLSTASSRLTELNATYFAGIRQSSSYRRSGRGGMGSAGAYAKVLLSEGNESPVDVNKDKKKNHRPRTLGVKSSSCRLSRMMITLSENDDTRFYVPLRVREKTLTQSPFNTSINHVQSPSEISSSGSTSLYRPPSALADNDLYMKMMNKKSWPASTYRSKYCRHVYKSGLADNVSGVQYSSSSRTKRSRTVKYRNRGSIAFPEGQHKFKSIYMPRRTSQCTKPHIRTHRLLSSPDPVGISIPRNFCETLKGADAMRRSKDSSLTANVHFSIPIVTNPINVQSRGVSPPPSSTQSGVFLGPPEWGTDTGEVESNEGLCTSPTTDNYKQTDSSTMTAVAGNTAEIKVQVQCIGVPCSPGLRGYSVQHDSIDSDSDADDVARNDMTTGTSKLYVNAGLYELRRSPCDIAFSDRKSRKQKAISHQQDDLIKRTDDACDWMTNLGSELKKNVYPGRLAELLRLSSEDQRRSKLNKRENIIMRKTVEGYPQTDQITARDNLQASTARGLRSRSKKSKTCSPADYSANGAKPRGPGEENRYSRAKWLAAVPNPLDLATTDVLIRNTKPRDLRQVF